MSSVPLVLIFIVYVNLRCGYRSFIIYFLLNIYGADTKGQGWWFQSFFTTTGLIENSSRRASSYFFTVGISGRHPFGCISSSRYSFSIEAYSSPFASYISQRHPLPPVARLFFFFLFPGRPWWWLRRRPWRRRCSRPAPSSCSLEVFHSLLIHRAWKSAFEAGHLHGPYAFRAREPKGSALVELHPGARELRSIGTGKGEKSLRRNALTRPSTTAPPPGTVRMINHHRTETEKNRLL